MEETAVAAAGALQAGGSGSFAAQVTMIAIITVALHGTADLWRPPTEITTVMSNEVQSVVQSLIPAGGVDAFWPQVVLSYATGSRLGVDAKGAGPGMYFAAAMIVALAGAGFPCFSGLCIPGGVDWKDAFPEWEPVHNKLFSEGILGIENVGGDLDAVTGKRCTFAFFPWNWDRGDGCIIRLVAMMDKGQQYRIEPGEEF